MAHQDKQPPKYDALLLVACDELGIAPESVMAWRPYQDRVVVVLCDGRKLVARTTKEVESPA
jgi:hypothetical protein